VSEGRLVLVATPIGNLGDLSPRAVSALAEADAVACEDTRRTGRLLEHAGVRARTLVVVNDHTESQRVPELLRRLDHGETVAVVSDAGTPGISDPGERLVRAAASSGHTVEVVPGPSAAIAGRARAHDEAVAIGGAGRRRGQVAVENRELDEPVEDPQRLVVSDVLLGLRREDVGQQEMGRGVGHGALRM
jgi:siroheme synthase